MKLIKPDWPTPPSVRAVITTRQGGMSEPPWATFNLGIRAGDDPAHVRDNRRLLCQTLELHCEPQWLHQVHGTSIIDVQPNDDECEADAAVSRVPGCAAVVLTADCLPVLLCDRSGTVVAAVHAGWRGLAGGVLRHTVQAMRIKPGELLAYLGPAISQSFFEVGVEVRDQFVEHALNVTHVAEIKRCFTDSENKGRLMADLYRLACAELGILGVDAVFSGDYCTYRQDDLFYSYRRDGVTGRMASLIWLT